MTKKLTLTEKLEKLIDFFAKGEVFVKIEKYVLFNDGRVYSLKSNKYLKPSLNQKGYPFVVISINNRRKNYPLHRLVAENFIQRYNKKELQVNHIDGDKLNNSVKNLEWVTAKENTQHALRTGLSSRAGFRKKVRQINKDGQIVSVFNSVKEALSVTGINNISACARVERLTAGGFRWEYLTNS